MRSGGRLWCWRPESRRGWCSFSDSGHSPRPGCRSPVEARYHGRAGRRDRAARPRRCGVRTAHRHHRRPADSAEATDDRTAGRHPHLPRRGEPHHTRRPRLGAGCRRGGHGITGPSGSGKSSILVGVAAALIRPDSGRVLIGDRADAVDAAGLPKAGPALRRERIGIVFQQSNLLPALTARATG